MVYYILVSLYHLPWILLVMAGVRKLMVYPGRIQRLQLEGTAILLFSSVAGWIMFDQNFGYDPERETRLTYWFLRGDLGLLGIGFLLLVMGFFLERRPRPDLEAWPRIPKVISVVAILVGALIGALLIGKQLIFGIQLPWSVSRFCLAVGWLPFAAGYLKHALNVTPAALRTKAGTAGLEDV